MKRLRRRGEDGAAMIIALMVMVLVGALATTVTTVTINHLQSSWRAQQAGSAMNAADAGVAQALAYLRSNGVRTINNCSPACTTTGWGNRLNPMQVTPPGGAGETYSVWIEKLAAYPANDTGRYVIHSSGSAAGNAARDIDAVVQVTGGELGKGVFAKEVAGGGSASVTRESVFSTGCVYRRSQIHMVAGQIDAAYGIPTAVHSTQTITDANGSGRECGDKKAIHSDPGEPCSNSYPYDQDRNGGVLSSSATPGCWDSKMTGTGAWAQFYAPRDVDGDGEKDIDGSFINEAGLEAAYGMQSPFLTQSQIDQLKAEAQAQDNYWTSASGWTSPDENQAVMFFDLNGGEVNLNNITGFGRAKNMTATDPACGTKSLVIVIVGGNAKLNSNQQLAASLFLTSDRPYGTVTKANGTSDFIGTMYADTINLVGNTDISLDPCFLDNPSPALLDINIDSYQEVDRD